MMWLLREAVEYKSATQGTLNNCSCCRAHKIKHPEGGYKNQLYLPNNKDKPLSKTYFVLCISYLDLTPAFAFCCKSSSPYPSCQPALLRPHFAG